MDALNDQQTTFYFTSFDCLADSTLPRFFAYHDFIQKLIIHLGEDWRIQSNLLWDEYHPQQDPEACSNMFNVFLQVFLLGRISEQTVIQTKSQNVLLEQFHQQVVKEFLRTVQPSKQQQLMDTLSFKTLSIGFFVTAQELLVQAFKSIKQANGKFNPATVELKPLIISIQNTFQDEIQKKSRTVNGESITNKQSQPSFTDFISSDNKTNAVVEPGKRGRQSSFKWQRFQTAEAIPQRFLAQIKQALVSNNKSSAWQLTSSIVTSMLQATYRKQGIQHQVRIIRICKQFYHAVILIWLLFNAKKNYSMKFRQYEYYVKFVLSDKWAQTYTLALKQIYNILGREWTQIVKQHAIDLNEDHEVMKIFLSRVRTRLQQHWQEKILTINPQIFN